MLNLLMQQRIKHSCAQFVLEFHFYLCVSPRKRSSPKRGALPSLAFLYSRSPFMNPVNQPHHIIYLFLFVSPLRQSICRFFVVYILVSDVKKEDSTGLYKIRYLELKFCLYHFHLSLQISM